MAVDFTSPWSWLGVAVLVAAAGLWLRYEFRHAADDMDPQPTCPDTAGNDRHLFGSGPRRELDHPAVEADILAFHERSFNDDDGRTA